MDDFDSIPLPAHANPIVIQWLKQGKLKIMPSGCWEWQMYRNRQGYGKVRIFLAHRIAINAPKGSNALHSCDNPPCCNPLHLRLGTIQENLTEAMEKGRLIKWHKNKCNRCECGRACSSVRCRSCTASTDNRICLTCNESGRVMNGLHCARCCGIKYNLKRRQPK